MKSIILVLLAATACGAATQKPSPEVSSFSAPGAAFGNYETFSFGLADQPKPGYDVTPRSLDVTRRLQSLVLEGMRARGYTNDATHADLVVKVTAGTGAASGQFITGADPYDGPDENVPANVAQGFIGISIYDAAKGTQVWQGTAFAQVDLGRIDDALLKRGVEHMLATVPQKKPMLIGAR